MADIGREFDVDSVVDNFEPLPAGSYVVAITASDMKQTKDEQGKYLKLELTVVQEQYRGRKLFDNLNLYNKNKTAEEIAWRTLSQIGKACGVEKISKSEVLHDIPILATVAIEKNEEHGDRNRIKRYQKASGTAGLVEDTKKAVEENAKMPWDEE